MTTQHLRITVNYGTGASPRQIDYTDSEGFDAFAEACELAARVIDESLSPVSVTITNLRKALDRATPAMTADNTPEHIVEAINASLLKRL